MKRPFVTVILAGGRGTRMGSGDRHKVCFDVLGVPVIVRALETYNLCGSRLNIVVVGTKAEEVMATVNERLPGTVFAYQESPRGTGHAARKAADILERSRFDGDVLVVAGDKLIEPRVIRQLLAAHWHSEADVTLATARRPPGSSTGILLRTARGNIVGILEEGERQRRLALAALGRDFGRRADLGRAEVERRVRAQCDAKAAAALLAELERGGMTATSLDRETFRHAFGEDERAGVLQVGCEAVEAARILDRFDQMNLSTYVFRAGVLCEALGRLRPARGTQEEYLTDVIEILAHRTPPARVAGCAVADVRDLMAYNNPTELAALEAEYRRKHGPDAAVEAAVSPRTLAPAGAWDRLLKAPSAAARRQMQRGYGDEVPWLELGRAVEAFIRRFGAAREMALIRSPGRINLLGRHIDHQGGPVNVMAINREVIAVAAPRTDDVVSMANADEARFSGRTFRIADLVANLDWEDWQGVIDGPRLQRMLDEARGDWATYAKAAVLRLQEQFRDQPLRGMDLVVAGNIPMGAGLSSSSALVVAVAEAVTAFNRLPVSARRLVSLCGEGEWFVGTRGGAADHAAIKLSRRGCVTCVGFFPFRIEDSAPALPGHDLIVCNSGIHAGKSHRARNAFNARVTAYHLGRFWLRRARPDLAPAIEHLRDVTAERLGLRRAEFAALLGQLPVRWSRRQAEAILRKEGPAERERIERLFMTHDAPPEGYAVRDVVLFGLSEMARARRCLDLLRRGDGRALGRLMTLSHDGDRVSRPTGRGTWRRAVRSVSDADLAAWGGRPASEGDVGELTGSYACSTPELDRIVDLALRCPGVEGAQLAGAGLGGCVMVLAQQAHTPDVLATLAGHGIQAEVFRPIAGACALEMA
ncbi:MAG TPA: galactokinase family protein [Verrucomicrobiota bacterium]|nr:galactokinase family protein [Verrucomicrobiota bacterium]HNU53156.1 galactokinase family protein [Verrucomicrobiota bacterium]